MSDNAIALIVFGSVALAFVIGLFVLLITDSRKGL